MINESTDDTFRTDLFSTFKNRISVSFKSPFNLRNTFYKALSLEEFKRLDT